VEGRILYKHLIILFLTFILFSCFNNQENQKTGDEILLNVLNKYEKEEIRFDLSFIEKNALDELIGSYKIKEDGIEKIFKSNCDIENYEITDEYIEINLLDRNVPDLIKYSAKILMEDIIYWLDNTNELIFEFYGTEVTYTDSFYELFNTYDLKTLSEIINEESKYMITVRTNDKAIYLGDIYLINGEIEEVLYSGHSAYSSEVESFNLEDDLLSVILIIEDMQTKERNRYEAEYTKEDIIMSLEAFGGRNKIDIQNAVSID